MKPSDFAPRTSALCATLSGFNLVGVEVGSDVGAHAEALLTYCDIRLLTLIDPWPNPINEGYCQGRLNRWPHKFKMRKQTSEGAVLAFQDGSLDFIYIDQEHDYQTVCNDLEMWWPKLKVGGIMALRNYAISCIGLQRAADEFVIDKKFIIDKYQNELLIWKEG